MNVFHEWISSINSPFQGRIHSWKGANSTWRQGQRVNGWNIVVQKTFPPCRQLFSLIRFPDMRTIYQSVLRDRKNSIYFFTDTILHTLLRQQITNRILTLTEFCPRCFWQRWSNSGHRRTFAQKMKLAAFEQLNRKSTESMSRTKQQREKKQKKASFTQMRQIEWEQFVFDQLVIHSLCLHIEIAYDSHGDLKAIIHCVADWEQSVTMKVFVLFK